MNGVWRTAVAATALLGALGSAHAHSDAGAGGTSTVPLHSREAYSQPSPVLPQSLRSEFFRGRALFRQIWVIAPALDGEVDGLGPTFNRASCLACHLKNGRGAAPEVDEDPLRAMLIRLSIPGHASHGGPLPHPVYGDQLNDAAIPGVPREGRAVIEWSRHEVSLADGIVVELRRPKVSLAEMAFGNPGADLLISPRIGPPVFGLGLLEAIGEDALRELARRDKPDGVRGRVNEVWDDTQQRKVVGRFGWKANVGTLRQQVAAALLGDLGITSPLLSKENCPPAQQACAGAVNGGTPEVTPEQLQAIVTYHQALAVPAARTQKDPAAQRGERIFEAAGCDVCHVAELSTGKHPQHAWLSHQRIRPYSDLLLHDMGEGLADGRPDFLASAREWRTPPLWGIGLTGRISERENYLHDGRARTLLEAILWHGGEAEVARERVRALPAGERDDLLRFLESL